MRMWCHWRKGDTMGWCKLHVFCGCCHWVACLKADCRWWAILRVLWVGVICCMDSLCPVSIARRCLLLGSNFAIVVHLFSARVMQQSRKTDSCWSSSLSMCWTWSLCRHLPDGWGAGGAIVLSVLLLGGSGQSRLDKRGSNRLFVVF